MPNSIISTAAGLVMLSEDLLDRAQLQFGDKHFTTMIGNDAPLLPADKWAAI